MAAGRISFVIVCTLGMLCGASSLAPAPIRAQGSSCVTFETPQVQGIKVAISGVNRCDADVFVNVCGIPTGSTEAIHETYRGGQGQAMVVRL